MSLGKLIGLAVVAGIVAGILAGRVPALADHAGFVGPAAAFLVVVLGGLARPPRKRDRR